MRGKSRLEIAPKEQRQHLGCIHAFAIGFGEIAGPVDIDNAFHFGRLLRISTVTLETANISGHSEKLSEVTARRATGNPDPIRVDTILGCVGSKPPYSGLGVLDGGGKFVLGRKAISHRHGDKALRGEFYAEAIIAFALAGAKAATMNAKDGGKRAIGLFGPGHVKLKRHAPRRCVFDSRLKKDIFWDFWAR